MFVGWFVFAGWFLFTGWFVHRLVCSQLVVEGASTELNNFIDKAIGSGMNLNTYFRDVVNPLNGINS